MNQIQAIRAASFGILAGLGSTVEDIGIDLPDVGGWGHVLVGIAVAGLIYSRAQ